MISGSLLSSVDAFSIPFGGQPAPEGVRRYPSSELYCLPLWREEVMILG